MRIWKQKKLLNLPVVPFVQPFCDEDECVQLLSEEDEIAQPFSEEAEEALDESYFVSVMIKNTRKKQLN